MRQKDLMEETSEIEVATYLEQGNTFREQGQWEEAHKYYKKAVELEPNSWQAHHHLGDALLTLEDYKNAINAYQKALSLQPNFTWSHYNLGVAWQKLGEWERAITCYQKLAELEPNFWEINQTDFNIQHQLGDYYFEQQQWERAIEVYQRAIQLNPDFCWSYCNLGRALQALNHLEEAVTVMQKAVEVDPDFAWGYAYWGDILLQQCKSNEAIVLYQKVLEIEANFPQIQEKLGDALLQKSRDFSRQALQYYQQALEKNKTNITLYHKLLEIQPSDPQLYFQLCQTLAETNQIEQAVVFYQMGLKAMIAQPDAKSDLNLMALGDHCANQGKLEAALFFYQEGLNVEPENDLLAWQIINTQAMKDREFFYPIETADYLRLKSPEPLTLLSSENPIVSIIIPVYNQILYTYNCLRSLAETLDGTLPYEVIIIDDHSQDKTQEFMAQIPGVKCYLNEQNLGFIESCNRGASLAKGEYLFFLNNDTIMMQNCLQELLETFKTFPEAGLVGAKFLYPNGKLQEAGGIIWQDGSGWNYGRLDHPNKPEYCYLREVDYCSGAGMMIPTQLWNKIGGFDVRLKPAYYEDTDLAFEVRKAGYKVYYQPLAKMIHFEGISSGTDLTQGMKQYQVVNHQKFLEKWQNALQSHRPNGVYPYLERERAVQKRLLMIDARMLMPDRDSGSLTAFNLIEIFQSLGYKVTFAPDNLLYVHKYTEDLQRIGVECLYCSYVTSIQSYLEKYGTLYDIVYLARLEVTEKYVNLVKTLAPQAKIIYDTVDLHHLREMREAKLRDSLQRYEQALETKKRELALMKAVDCTLVVSRLEQELLQQEHPELENIEFFHMPRKIYGSTTGFEQREHILFIGGFEHPPNVDAVLYFVQEIFPLVKQEIQGIKFFIIGSKAPPEVVNLATEDVIITGYVPDISGYFNQCKLSVAPLRYGAGIKGKILTSFSYGLPVVGTSMATEGMGVKDGHDVLIGDDATMFAQQIVRLYTHSQLWENLSQNALETVSSRYSTEAVTRKFKELFRNLGVMG